MALAELIGKLRSRKQTAARSAFGHYIEAVRTLANGAEIDADEIGHIIESAGKDESNLERDTELQAKRFEKVAERERNLQAVQDRQRAENDLRAAQAALQAAYDRLMPAVDMAQSRVSDANLVFSCTTGAESWLCDPANILDRELLEREAAIVVKLREVNSELKPLMSDRGRLQTALENAEFQHTQKTRSTGRVAWFVQAKNADELAEIVTNLQSQLRQLAALIHPRQQKQARLQAELNAIHQEKLLP